MKEVKNYIICGLYFNGHTRFLKHQIPGKRQKSYKYIRTKARWSRLDKIRKSYEKWENKTMKY